MKTFKIILSDLDDKQAGTMPWHRLHAKSDDESDIPRIGDKIIYSEKVEFENLETPRELHCTITHVHWDSDRVYIISDDSWKISESFKKVLDRL